MTIRAWRIGLAALLCFTTSHGLVRAATIADGDVLRFHLDEAKLDVPAEIGVPDTGAPNLRNGRRPAIFVLHGCDGWNGATKAALREEARWYRRRGFVTILPDGFGPRGATDVCNAQNVAPSDRAEDLFGIARQLDRLDGVAVDLDRLFAVGYSHGGSSVVEAALAQTSPDHRGPRLKGIFSYYPDCLALRGAGALDVAPATLLILIGGRDTLSVPEECVQAVKDAADPEHVRAWVFPNATHAFNLRVADPRAYGQTLDMRLGGAARLAGTRISYDQRSADEAQGIVADYLRSLGYTVD
jgi:dienelactone hydrolase